MTSRTPAGPGIGEIEELKIEILDAAGHEVACGGAGFEFFKEELGAGRLA